MLMSLGISLPQCIVYGSPSAGDNIPVLRRITGDIAMPLTFYSCSKCLWSFRPHVSFGITEQERMSRRRLVARMDHIYKPYIWSHAGGPEWCMTVVGFKGNSRQLLLLAATAGDTLSLDWARLTGHCNNTSIISLNRRRYAGYNPHPHSIP